MTNSISRNSAKTVNDQKIRGMTPGCAPLVESLPGRGTGAMIFKRPNDAPPICYYRYHLAGKQVLIKLAAYRRNVREVGLSLPDLRDKAATMAQIAKEHGDVKAYLAEQMAQAEAERIEAKSVAEVARIELQLQAEELQRHAEVEASRGSFADLFLDYIESRRDKATPGVVKELERLLKANMETPQPAIMRMKARDIRPCHIFALLNPIWERGAKVQASHMRSFLSAAFNHGLSAESYVGRTNTKIYNLESNPAAAVKVEKVSVPHERALSDAELRRFWETIETTQGVGPVMALLFKFIVATGGQRVKNILETTWEDYDLEAGTVRLTSRKGGSRKSRLHLVPLTKRATEIVKRVQEINGCHAMPWTTHGGNPFDIGSPTHAVTDWLNSKNALINEQQIPRFSTRDLRRTCTQLMQKHGVSAVLSDLLQAHGLTGVVSLHYRNNPQIELPDKCLAIESFDRALAIVFGEIGERESNVVPIPLLASRAKP